MRTIKSGISGALIILKMANVQELKLVLKQNMKGWSDVPADEIQFDRLSGFTNVTYRVSHGKKERKSLVFKRFSNVEGLIERDKENLIFKQLSDRGIGPKCYFYNDKCRIEEFLEQGRHPTIPHLKSLDLKKSIVSRLASYHEIQIPSIQNDQTFVDYFLSNEFIQQARKRIVGRQYTGDKKQTFEAISSYLTMEKMQQVRNILMPLRKQTVRLCHNDLNNLNIMLLGKEKEVFFIDFEYSRYNYIAYDIANFLNESAIDYTLDEYPFFQVKEDCISTKEDIQAVCQAYLEEKMKKHGYYFTEEDLKILSEETYRCLGLCNFYWAIWSIMMDNSHTSFGYIEHGRKRLQLFQKIYKEFLNKKTKL